MDKQTRQKITSRFDAENHRYYCGDLEIPGVTFLLQDARLIDYSRVDPDRLNYKRDLGLAVDYACDLLDQDNLDESTLHKDIVNYVCAYKKFKEIEKFEPIIEKSQVPLVSIKWKFGGRPDILGTFVERFNESICLVDRKCTFSMYPSTGAQLAGYEILAQENFKIKIVKKYGLLLKPNGNYELVEFKDPTYKTDFLSSLHLYWRRRNHYHTSKEIQNDHAE